LFADNTQVLLDLDGWTICWLVGELICILPEALLLGLRWGAYGIRTDTYTLDLAILI
jgi:hypothetical protein